MPVSQGRDANGVFYRWGHRTKYYYIQGDKKSRDKAKQKAKNQGIAVYASGWKGK